MVKYDVSDHAEWTKRTSGLKAKKVKDVLFSDIFKEYLPYNKRLECIEIGAIPGSFLVFLHKEFGYKITGLDFADNEQSFVENMAANKIKDYKFIKRDFLSFKTNKKYDVVCSFGFIEHFDEPSRVIKKHCELVNRSGYLILTTPNFRNLQYIYHRIFDKPNLDIHNIEVMRPKMITDIVRSYGFDPIFTGYTGNLEIWRHPYPLSPRLQKVNEKIEKFVRDHPEWRNSKFYSPYMVCIYKRLA